MGVLGWGIDQVVRGHVPDWLTRLAIRRIVAGRRRTLPTDAAAVAAAERDFVQAMAAAPVADVPDKANQQHYEVPAAFFPAALGPQRKYSSCYYETPETTLAAAEERALAETAAHADLRDGQDVLELGCGWGSLSLWMAEHYPKSRVTGVSNSASQRAYIEGEASARSLANLRIITADMNVFAPAAEFDRIVSVEMFEHMRNWPLLLRRVAGWLRADGRLFLHVFAHRAVPYFYAADGEADWMARYFFSGGIMPSRSLIRQFADTVAVEAEWWWEGRHYQRTAEDWLVNLDAQRAQVMPVLVATYGADAERWLQRWRMFFLAVAELFGHRAGGEWGVAHYRLRRAP
ncbi:MAG: class I SAM-dependent methyltransferase [Alphaproteobacteria bacterium]|nr:class I SAM-dependent methyltransferase [Alphaproteobacteria bacterium]